MTPKKDKRIFFSEEEREDFCSADNGDPYPPCVNPNHTCEDCKRTHESAHMLLEAIERRKQAEQGGFTITTTL